MGTDYLQNKQIVQKKEKENQPIRSKAQSAKPMDAARLTSDNLNNLLQKPKQEILMERKSPVNNRFNKQAV